MSDLRGLSRGSKTAAVVILVVLLQVIVVAVLGLGAISRDREEGARLAADDARRHAHDRAVQIGEQARDGLTSAIKEASRLVLGPGGLKNPPRDGWYRSVLEFYRVDAEGRVRSADGTLLFVPPEVIAAEEQRADRGVLERMERRLDALDPLPGSTDEALSARRTYAKEFPYRTDGALYARAVGAALRNVLDMAVLAAGPAGTAPSPSALEDAVVLAYQTAAVNARRPAAAQPTFAFVRAQLAKVAAEPGRESLAVTLAALDRARVGLDGFLEYALPQAKDAAANAMSTRVFALRGNSQLVGLCALPQRSGESVAECLLTRLDRLTLALVIEERVATPGAARNAASSVRILQREAPADAEFAVRLPLQHASFDPALDVLVPIGPALPAAKTTGPRETFYWFILGLAALGVSIAGWILVRILRKEVHLARLKADFVSNLSHELKTPLTSIGMFTEMLREERLTPADRTEAVEVISTESERLQRIVTRMIDVARREAESTGYALTPGDVNAPVRAACERFRRLERSPGLTLDVHLAPDLPPVLLDAGAIDDAVTNLLSNAWKYRRGEAAHVRVSTTTAGRGVELVVSDDGIGIPRHERRRVFEMFYRAENFLSRNVPGTGLGLALVRTIVRVHRGKVRIEGAAGAGTTFRVRLPATRRAIASVPPSDAGDALSASPPRPTTGTPQTSGSKSPSSAPASSASVPSPARASRDRRS